MDASDLYRGAEDLRQRADAGDSEACNRLGMYLIENAPHVEPLRGESLRPMSPEEFDRAVNVERMNRSAVLEDAYIGMMYRSQYEDPALLQQEYEELAASLGQRVAAITERRTMLVQAQLQQFNEAAARRQLYLERAAHYFQKSADLGDPEGMWNLGWRYFLGQGVAHDESQARTWWRNAASHGHAQAMAKLIELGTPGSTPVASQKPLPASSLVGGMAPTTEKPTVILFLAAEPSDLGRLRLGREAREIQEKLQLAKFRERFRFEQRHAVRPADLTQALLDYTPQIVHFAGHGSEDGELCLEDLSGNARPVTSQGLQAVFAPLAQYVQCVVLNACYSIYQAEAIAQYIPYVVGVAHDIEDEAAISFAVGFYQAIGAGLPVETAVVLGNAQMSLLGFDPALAATLHRRPVP